MRKKIKQFEAMQIRIDFLEEEVKKKDHEAMLVRIELLEKEVKTLRGKSKTAERFEIPTLRDNIFDDVPTSEIMADLREAKTAHQKLISSDDESTAEGSYPTQKRYEDFTQQSSPVKIFEPNSSVLEKFTEKKFNKALKEMGQDEDAKNIRAKSTRVIKPGPSLVTPYKVYDPAIGITNKRLKTHVRVEYDPFALVDSQKTKALDEWLELKLNYPIGSGYNGEFFFNVIRTPQGWLTTLHIESAMNMLRLRFMKNQSTFRTRRIAFIDAYFAALWTRKYNEFLDSKDVPIFPHGSFQYAKGELPAFAQSGMSWRVDVDDIYCVLNITENHWVALVISIPGRSIEVLDCGFRGTSNEVIVTAVKPIAHMLPHLLRAAAPQSERGSMSVERYKIRRPQRGIPQMLKVGDCGIYAIKFIECHALGVPFTTPISDLNIKMVREKLTA